MAFKCPQCGYSAEQAGDCPTCNVSLVEEKEESAPEQDSSSSESQQPEA